jgi:replicative DNA helicase
MSDEIDAERPLLGSMMLDPSVIEGVAAIVKPWHFRNGGHRLVAESIVRLHQSRPGCADVVTVAEDLEARGHLEVAGGPAGLAALLESVPHAGHAKYYAQVVRDRHDRMLAN